LGSGSALTDPERRRAPARQAATCGCGDATRRAARKARDCSQPLPAAAPAAGGPAGRGGRGRGFGRRGFRVKNLERLAALAPVDHAVLDRVPARKHVARGSHLAQPDPAPPRALALVLALEMVQHDGESRGAEVDQHKRPWFVRRQRRDLCVRGPRLSGSARRGGRPCDSPPGESGRKLGRVLSHGNVRTTPATCERSHSGRRGGRGHIGWGGWGGPGPARRRRGSRSRRRRRCRARAAARGPATGRALRERCHEHPRGSKREMS
jgi:hypothetical protein